MDTNSRRIVVDGSINSTFLRLIEARRAGASSARWGIRLWTLGSHRLTVEPLPKFPVKLGSGRHRSRCRRIESAFVWPHGGLAKGTVALAASSPRSLPSAIAAGPVDGLLLVEIEARPRPVVHFICRAQALACADPFGAREDL